MLSVGGKVIDSNNGNPIENATVIVGTNWALSDDWGRFTIAAQFEPGVYTIKVLQRNYQPLVSEISLSYDSNLDIPLVPS